MPIKAQSREVHLIFPLKFDTGESTSSNLRTKNLWWSQESVLVKNIRKMKFCWNMRQTDDFVIILILDEMEIDFYVLGLFM